jgi:type VI secretion system secreted protein Hcp
MFIKFEEPAVSSGAELEILSWNHGISQPASPTRSTAGGGTIEQANYGNFTFSKYLDATTNELLKFCWSGKQIGKATLTCFRSDGAADNRPVKYLEIVMQHVVISSYAVSGGPGDIPVENVSLDYEAIRYNYIDQRRPMQSVVMNKATGTIE